MITYVYYACSYQCQWAEFTEDPKLKSKTKNSCICFFGYDTFEELLFFCKKEEEKKEFKSETRMTASILKWDPNT